MSIKNIAVFITTTTLATAGLYGVLDYTSTEFNMEPAPLPVAYSSANHEACWTETANGKTEVVCNTSSKWASWVAECINAALADGIKTERKPYLSNNDLAQSCMSEGDKHSNDS